MTHDPRVQAAALDWAIRQRDPAFADWDAFTDWLAADAAHADAYHAVAALDAEAGGLADLAPREAVSAPVAAQWVPAATPPRVRRADGRRLLAVGALAASLVGIVSINVLNRAPDSYRIETRPGQSRTITLKDGTKVAINGGSAIRLNADAPRVVTLEHGQALFVVVHHADDPFRVDVGKARLVDVGTTFDVTRTGSETVVAVSEGAVAYNPEAENVRIDAGRKLALRDGSTDAQVSRIDPAAVGGWRNGQLVYDGASLETVAAEVTRTTGVRIKTAPGAAAISFRGALQTGSDEKRMVADLAALSGTQASHDAAGWTLSR